jgi:putative membrane protein
MRRFAFAAFMATALAGPAFAQQMSAQDFVNMAAVGGMFEVQSSELALTKSQDQAVKDFAQQMVTDHTAANERLMTLASEQQLTVPSELDEKHQQRVDTLNNANAQNFDPVYGQFQVEAHQEAVQLFEGYSQQGDNDALKAFATETLPTLQQHFDKAKTLPGAGNATTTQ